MAGGAEAAAAGISAVVVNHDGGAALLSCVASLRRAGIGEVVVVDNASSDGSLEALFSADEAVVLLPTGRNLGYGAAANIGAKATRGEYLVVSNPDVEVCEGAVAVLQRALARRPELAVAAPALVSPDGSLYPSARAFPSLAEGAGHAFIGLFRPDNAFTRAYRREGAGGASAEVDWVSGAFLLVRRVAFESVGGFDERYFMYVEDLDLCWRLRRAGWSVAYEPAAKVRHVGGLTTGRRPYRMLAAHHASAWRFELASLRGRRRLLLPAVGGGLLARFGLSAAKTASARLRSAVRGEAPAK